VATGPAYVDSAGHTWVSGTGLSGGSSYTTTAAIANTADQPLYKSERFGDFTYATTEPNGTYNVTLKFAENYWTSPGQRVFNVSINGQPVLSNFDILTKTAPNTALDETFPVTVTNGTVTVSFQTVTDNAKVNAI